MLNGRRYSDEQRDAVFGVWAFAAGRSGDKTVRLIVDDPACIELGITDCSAKTVLNWAAADDWSGRADRILHASAPRLRFETQVSLILVAPESARFLRAMVNLDPELKTERTIVDKDGNAHTFMEFNDKVLKLRMTSAIATLDRTGFSPIGTRDVLGAIDDPPTSLDEAKRHVDTMDTDALKEHERYIRTKIGIGRGN